MLVLNAGKEFRPIDLFVSKESMPGGVGRVLKRIV